MWIRLLLVCMFTLIPRVVSSDVVSESPRCASQQLESLYKRLLDASSTSISYDEELELFQVGIGDLQLPLSISYAEDGTLDHLGFLLPPTPQATSSERLVWKAAERELLELLLGSGNWLGLPYRVIKAHDIHWFFNGSELGLLNTPRRTDLAQIVLRHAQADFKATEIGFDLIWSANSQTLRLHLPARQDILLGFDKREWDAYFYKCLESALDHGTAGDPDSSHMQLFKPQQRAKPGFYYEPILGDDDSTRAYVFTPGAALPSLVNTLLVPQVLGIEAQVIIQDRAQNLASAIQGGFQTFLDYFRPDHAMWIGIESQSDTRIEFYLLFEHLEFHHLHVFSGVITPDDLFHQRPLNIRLIPIPNIRQDNLRSLFPDHPDLGASDEE